MLFEPVQLRGDKTRNELEFRRDRRKTCRRKLWTRLRVTHLARILRSFSVTGAHHLVVDYNVYAVGLVPPLALSVVDDRHVDGLQRLWPQSRTCVAKNTQKQQQNTVYYRQTINYFSNILHSIFKCRSVCDPSPGAWLSGRHELAQTHVQDTTKSSCF